jgi:RNA polymerase sigma-70 factor, ECF subfamily
MERKSMEDHELSAARPRRPASHSPHFDGGDCELLRRISCADRGAFEQLYFDYHTRLVKFLFHVIRRPEELEAVINDTFQIVWQHAGDFRGASPVSTWIFGIAYRRALETIRISSVRVRDAALEVWEGEAVVEPAVRETDGGRLLEFGISRLPPEQRLVLVLAYCMDCSCEEIAAIVACSVNTVKSRMWLARRRLRAIFSAAATPQGTFLGEEGAAQTQDLRASVGGDMGADSASPDPTSPGLLRVRTRYAKSRATRRPNGP